MDKQALVSKEKIAGMQQFEDKKNELKG